MCNRKNNIVKISVELKKATRKDFIPQIAAYLIFEIALIVVVFGMDIISRETECNVVYMLCKMKHSILDDFFDIIMTLQTILVAIVVLFYSIQDNRSGGIPYRTIIAYAFGSFSVPALLIWTMVLLPVNFWAVSFGYRRMAWAGLICTYITQMIIMVLILLSTSFQYSVHAIGNAEILQFQKLNDLEEIRYQNRNVQEPVTRKTVEQNPQYVWTYLLHHLEQVLLSNELFSDKQQLTRRLIRAPYYQNAVKFRGVFYQIAEEAGLEIKSKPQISARRLSSNHMKCVYEFYYLNFLEVFRHINEPEDLEERNKVYLILYEFIEELTELYEGVKRDRFSEESIIKCRNNYLMTISGILNAMMDSGVENGESACYYILNNIVSQKVREFQIGLFFLFQEFLFHTNVGIISLSELYKIDKLEEWCCQEEERDLYSRFWQIWVGFSTLSKSASYEYFDRAFEALRGEYYNEGPASYICLMIQRTKGGI